MANFLSETFNALSLFVQLLFRLNITNGVSIGSVILFVLFVFLVAQYFWID